MATIIAMPHAHIAGGSFLIEDRTPDEVFTPEDFSEQHLLIAQTAEEFATKEIVPNIEKLERKDFGLLRELVRKAGELGLSGADVPEQYGGMEMDKITSALIAERLAKYGGFSATWGAHTCIGTLPIVYFGTEGQKKGTCRDWRAAKRLEPTPFQNHHPGLMRSIAGLGLSSLPMASTIC